MKFYCIADEDTARGFRLAGVAALTAVSTAQAEAALEEITALPDCGIIIITERVAEMIRPRVNEIREGRDRPLIVEIPGPDGPLAGRKSLRELVQEAVGISVG